jgi:hypothetical protein
MRRLSSLMAAVLLGVPALASTALAQPPMSGPAAAPACRSHTDLAEMLDQKFAEKPSALGLQSNGHLLEVFVANDGTSWTILVTNPDGWSCIVAVGEHWESLPVVAGPLA